MQDANIHFAFEPDPTVCITFQRDPTLQHIRGRPHCVLQLYLCVKLYFCVTTVFVQLYFCVTTLFVQLYLCVTNVFATH